MKNIWTNNDTHTQKHKSEFQDTTIVSKLWNSRNGEMYIIISYSSTPAFTYISYDSLKLFLWDGQMRFMILLLAWICGRVGKGLCSGLQKSVICFFRCSLNPLASGTCLLRCSSVWKVFTNRGLHKYSILRVVSLRSLTWLSSLFYYYRFLLL